MSLAGPAANLLVAFLLAIPFLLGMVPLNASDGIWPAVAFLVRLQFCAVLLNLIPIPPLDGYGAVSPWLPNQLRRVADRSGMIGMIIIFLVLWNFRPANLAFWGFVDTLTSQMQVPSDMAWKGYFAFKFWEK